MKILIVSQYFYPEDFLINDIAFELKRRGHDVTVLTGLPNYPSGIIPDEYKKKNHRNESVNGVRVIRCNEIPRKDSIIGLGLNYLSFMISGSFKALQLSEKFDVVFSYELSPITQVHPAFVASHKSHCKLCLYCLDIFPESVRSHVNKENLIYKTIASYSKWIYKKCDSIAVTSLPFVEYLHNINNVPLNKITYIPQHSNSSFLNIVSDSSNDRIAHIVFAGNIGYAQVPDVIINTVEFMKGRTDFVVDIIGDGSLKKTMCQHVKDKGLDDKFFFHGHISKSQMSEKYQMADILLITLRGDLQTGNTLPGKLQTYMAVGKPVAAAANGATKQIIEEAECGFCASAMDSKELAKKLTYMLDNRDQWGLWGCNARNYFNKHFTFDLFMEKLLDFLTM